MLKEHIKIVDRGNFLAQADDSVNFLFFIKHDPPYSHLLKCDIPRLLEINVAGIAIVFQSEQHRTKSRKQCIGRREHIYGVAGNDTLIGKERLKNPNGAACVVLFGRAKPEAANDPMPLAAWYQVKLYRQFGILLLSRNASRVAIKGAGFELFSGQATK